MAHLIRKYHEVGIHTACWIFSIAKGPNDETIRDEMRTIIKRNKGGFHGMNDRLKYYELCKQHIAA